MIVSKLLGSVSLDFVRSAPSNMYRCCAFSFALAGLSCYDRDVTCNVCKGSQSGNTTEPTPRCECVNECEVFSFSPTISSSKLSPSVILSSIGESSDISARFIAATETRHRVEASLMMNTVSLLTDAVQAHRRMKIQINTDIVDAGTSWTTALSKLLASLGNMMRGHIADSNFLISTLNDVYLMHVSYLVTGLSSQLDECYSLTAEVHVITTRVQSSLITEREVARIQQLLDIFRYLETTINDFDEMLMAEARKSPHNLHYFPGHLHIGDCTRVFTSLKNLLLLQIIWLDDLNINSPSDISAFESPIDDIIFFNMTVFRSTITNLSHCLLSYKNELGSFNDKLSTLTLTTSFDYEPPTTSLRMFSMDGDWLNTITSQYIANSLSKLDLATALHANGSELLTNADQLYSDIELSLFSKVSDHINKQEKEMVTFYKDLLQQIASLQRYMFTNDTELEQFMRRLSIWRMPIVNFQKSQVGIMLLFHVIFVMILTKARVIEPFGSCPEAVYNLRS